LLKIILFAYSKGITSSREIQWCCESNIIFKALSCDSVPHFTTIASFVSGYPEQIETLFEQILLICDEQGLLDHELFAVVEPVFGNITSNKGLKRFSLRGKSKVNTQWKLFCLIQNIEKLANYGKIAA
jgi:transposase